MDTKRRLSSGYIVLEVSLIAFAALSFAYLELIERLSWPHALTNLVALSMYLAIFCVWVATPTALGGLFGRKGMVAGAVCGVLVFVVWAAWFLSTPFKEFGRKDESVSVTWDESARST